MTDSRDFASPAPDPRPDAIIAGTLCLMSCYAQHASPAYASRIADNLRCLAGVASLTAEFRAVCRRMAERWSALEDEARSRVASGTSIPDGRTLQ